MGRAKYMKTYTANVITCPIPVAQAAYDAATATYDQKSREHATRG